MTIHYDIPADEYHSGKGRPAALSASIAGILYGKSPLHAWCAHSQLNPAYQSYEDSKFDIGTCAHSMLLENDESKIAVLEFDDYRKKEARERRDEARASGKTPILSKHMRAVQNMVLAAKGFIKQTELAHVLSDGHPEVTIFQQHEGMYLKSRLDWLTTDKKIIVDLKTTDGAAKPEAFIRGPMRALHYDMKAEFYRMMVGLETGTTPNFYWLVQETEYPYACSWVGMAPSLQELGQRKLQIAMRLWKTCMDTGNWPCYDTRIAHAEAEAWQITTVEEREINDFHFS